MKTRAIVEEGWNMVELSIALFFLVVVLPLYNAAMKER